MLLVETISLLQAICGFGMLSSVKNKIESVGGIIGLFVDKVSCGLVRRCGKNVCRLNRRKFELKQKDIHLLEEEVVVYSKFT